MRASTSDIYGVLNSILVEQKKGQHPLKFSIDRETLHSLSTDQEKAMKELMAVNSSMVDSLPSPIPARGKKPRRSRKAASSDGEQFDFSPIPGNVTPGPPTTPLVVPNSKLLIYTENVCSWNFLGNFPSPPSPPEHDLTPSLQSLGSAPLGIQPITTNVVHAPPQTEPDNLHGTRLMQSSPQSAKRKDRPDNPNSNLLPLPKKRKKDKPKQLPAPRERSQR